MVTIATTHSGGEGVGVGARSAGLAHLWGIEFDERICEVARANGFHSLCADVNSVGLRSLEPPDVLHSSPVCKNASVAKAKRGEREGDIESGKSVVSFIRFLRPKIFTLENVWGYRKFEAFKLILDTLTELGYAWDVTHVNAADFGAPQTRKRLILRATRYGKKVLPPYPAKEAWVGWYAAIEDLIPTLPESKFAPWQLARLPEEIRDSFSVTAGNSKAEGKIFTESSMPARTVDGSSDDRIRAFIANTREMHDHREENALTVRNGEEPLMTLSASGAPSRLKAFIMPSVNADGTAHERGAFIPDDVHPMTPEEREKWEHDEQQRYHAEHKPKRPAWLSSGRVVAMTPRCLARFQSFPDAYILPDKKSLAATVIGNAVPPLLYEKIVRQLVDTL